MMKVMVTNKVALVLLALALAVTPGCGLDAAINGKVNETLNPPAAKKTPEALFTVSAESVQRGNQVTVDGSYSYDPQGEALTYAWTLVAPAGSAATIASATSAVTSFTVDEGGYYVVSLQVTNASTKTSEVVSKTVTGVGTDGANIPPVAILATTATATATNTVVLDGSGSYDANGNELTYTWTVIGAPSTSAESSISNTTGKYCYLYSDVAGTYTLRLVVDDGKDTDEAYITVTVA